MSPFYRRLALSTSALVAIGLSGQAAAQEITGANYGAATAIIDGSVLTDTTDDNAGAGDFGAADANGGSFNSILGAFGVVDGASAVSTLTVIDSVGGGDIWTIDSDLAVSQDGGNTDTVNIEVGSSDGGTSDLLSTGIVFDGNINAGLGAMNIETMEGANADIITFNSDTIDLGSGAITVSAVGDQIVLSGSSLQTLTGDIVAGTAGDGALDVDNSTTIAGTVGAAGAIGSADIADGQTLTIQSTGAAAAIGSTVLNTSGVLALDSSNAGSDLTFTGDIAGSGTISALGSANNVILAGGSGNSIAAGTVTVSGAAKTLTLGGAGDTVAISGNITSAEDGVHTLLIAADGAATTVGGNIGGGASTDFALIDANEALSVTGSIWTADVDAEDQFDVGDTLNATGTVDLAGASTVGGDLGASALTTSSTLFVAGDTGATGAVTLDGAGTFMGELSAGTVAVNEDSSVGGDLTTASGTTIATTKTLTLDGAAAQAVSGTINGAAAGQGTLAIDNTHASGVTVSGVVGGSAPLAAIDVGTSAGADHVAVFESDVDATTITIGALDTAGATATFKDYVTATNIVLGTGASADVATLNLDNTAGDMTITGAISSGNAGNTATVNVLGGNTTHLATAMGADVDALNIAGNTVLDNAGGGAITAAAITLQAADAELNITEAATTVTGALDASTAGEGVFDVDANTTMAGVVGGSGALADIQIADATVLDNTGGGNISSTAITLEGATAELNITAAGTIAAAIDATSAGEGILDIDASTTLAGVVGGSGALADIQIADATVLDNTGGGNISSTAITLEGATAELNITAASTITGAIDASVAGQGILDVDADTTLAGVVGGSAALDEVQIDASTTLTAGGNVSATDIVLAAGDSVLQTATAAIITGDISGGGDLDINEDTTVDGLIGTDSGASLDALDAITVTAGKTLTLGAGATTVDAASITLEGASATLNVANASTITTDVEGDGSSNGVLAINEDATLVGNAGATNQLASVAIAATKTLTVDGDTAAGDLEIDAADLNVLGTLAIDGNDSGTITISGPVTGDGTIIITDDGAAGTTATFAQSVGTSGTAVASLTTTDAGVNVQALTFAGDTHITAMTLDGDDRATFTGSGKTVSGAIDGAGGASEGEVAVADAASVTFEGDLGSSNALDLFTVLGTGTATLEGDLTTEGDGAATALSVASGATLNIDSSGGTVTISDTGTNAADYTLAGTLGVTGANDVTIDAAGNKLSIDGTLTTALTGGASLILADGTNVDIGTNADTTITASNQIDLTGDGATIGAAGRTNTLEIVKTADFDPTATTVMDATGQTVTIAAGSTLNVVLDNSSLALDHNDTITVVDAGTLTNDGTVNFSYLGSSVMSEFSGSEVSETLVATFTHKDGATVFGAGTRGVGASDAVLQGTTIAQAAAAGGTLDTARTALANATTVASAQTIAESLAPIVNRAAPDAVTALNRQASAITGDRVADLRGALDGDYGRARSIWGQAFGTSFERDASDGIEGHDSDGWGLTIGADTALGEDAKTIVGASFTYGDVDADSSAGVRSKEEIGTYQIALYADRDLGNDAYLSGQVSYAWSDSDTTRYDVGGTGTTARGSYDAQTIGVRAELGRDYKPEADGALTLTPFAMANYLHWSPDDYTETGADTANLSVDYDDVSVFELGAGLEAGWDLVQSGGAVFRPSLHASARYDLIGDEVSASSTLAGAGPSFVTKGADPEQATVNAGFDLSYEVAGQWEISAGYDFDYNSDLEAHTGLVRTTYKF